MENMHKLCSKIYVYEIMHRKSSILKNGLTNLLSTVQQLKQHWQMVPQSFHPKSQAQGNTIITTD